MTNRPVAGTSLVLTLLMSLPLVAARAGEAAAPSLAADSRVAEAIEVWKEWVEYHAAINGVPGVSVGVVHDQELLDADAFGVSDPLTGQAAQPETLYSICSISKLFTSLAVLQLRDAGKLRLDDPVASHLSWFDIEDTYRDDAPVTVRGLLTHSSGLPRESDFPYWTLSLLRAGRRHASRERGSQTAGVDLEPVAERCAALSVALPLNAERGGIVAVTVPDHDEPPSGKAATAGRA